MASKPSALRCQERGSSSISTLSMVSPCSRSRCGSRSLIAPTTSMPSTTSPKTACLSSSQGVATYVMKNCDPPVFGPALAMERMPGLSWRSWGWNSSGIEYPGASHPRARRVAALDHEVRDHTMKSRPVEVPVARQKHEVVDRLGRVLREEPELHRALLGDEVGEVLVTRLQSHLGRPVVGLVRHRVSLRTCSSECRTHMLSHHRPAVACYSSPCLLS